jgi:ABC-type transporter MlaC component
MKTYLFLLLSFFVLADAKKEVTFTGESLVVKTWLDELFKSSQKVNTPKNDKNPNRAKILSALDWERIAKDCLGKKQWDKQTKKREEFQSLLKDVIGNTAWGRLEDFWKNTNYQFKKIQIKGNEGVVDAQFVSGSDIVALTYYVTKKGSHWYVYDISLEDLRYSEDIKEKLESFLAEKSFDELLKSLRKRLADLKEDSKSGAKPKSDS